MQKSWALLTSLQKLQDPEESNIGDIISWHCDVYQMDSDGKPLSTPKTFL